MGVSNAIFKTSVLFDPITGKRNQICRERTGTPTPPEAHKRKGIKQEVIKIRKVLKTRKAIGESGL